MELGPEALDKLINKFMDSEEGRNLIDNETIELYFSSLKKWTIELQGSCLIK